jgi:hypothetical protein
VGAAVIGLNEDDAPTDYFVNDKLFVGVAANGLN